jgi:predicted PurR-regulated permease PerM
VLLTEALETSQKASIWISRQTEQPDQLQRQIEAVPALQRWLPYQDQILEKAGELAGKASGFVAQQLAAGARGTASFFLMLFVMLYAMFYFLVYGKHLLRVLHRFTPLTNDDSERLLKTFVSVARATLKGGLVIGLVQGGLAGLSFAVAGIHSAVFWGSVMAVLSIIPGVGTPLVWIPAVVYLGLEGEMAAAVGVGIWCAVVVGSVDTMLRPLLIGKDTQMPDLLVLLTTLGGLMLFGAAGIVIGPIVGALFLTVWQLLGAAVEAERNPKEEIEHGEPAD